MPPWKALSGKGQGKGEPVARSPLGVPTGLVPSMGGLREMSKADTETWNTARCSDCDHTEFSHAMRVDKYLIEHRDIMGDGKDDILAYTRVLEVRLPGAWFRSPGAGWQVQSRLCFRVASVKGQARRLGAHTQGAPFRR